MLIFIISAIVRIWKISRQWQILINCLFFKISSMRLYSIKMLYNSLPVTVTPRNSSGTIQTKAIHWIISKNCWRTQTIGWRTQETGRKAEFIFLVKIISTNILIYLFIKKKFKIFWDLFRRQKKIVVIFKKKISDSK